jgi:adenine-specific DNA-methyltransferase
MNYTLHLGDCLEIMRGMDAGSVDLVFADPPFNVGKKYGSDNGSGDKRTDYYQWCDLWITECFRVLRDTGTFYLMTLDQHLEKKFPMMGSHGVFINLVKWRNVSANHGKKQYWNISQPILVYGKTEDYKFNTYAQVRRPDQARDIWGKARSERAKRRLFDYWDDIPLVYAGSVVHPEAILEPGTNRKLHPCQMPIALPERALLFSTDMGDTILDPFGGLFSTGMACQKHNRNFIGIEKNKRYFETGQNRIENAAAQPLLPYPTG